MKPAAPQEIRHNHRAEFESAPSTLTGCQSCGDPEAELKLVKAGAKAHPHPDATALQDEYRCGECGAQTIIGLKLEED